MSTPPPPQRDRSDDAELLSLLFRNHHPPDAADAGPGWDLTGRELEELNEQQFMVAVMEATAGRERDGHSGVFPTAQPSLELWPVQLYRFADGWRVVDAVDPELVGREVTGIGGPVADAVERVSPLVPHDNVASLTGRLPLYLVVPDVLEGVGLRPALELDGEPITLTPMPADEYADRFGIFYPLVCPPLPRPDQPHWSLDETGQAVILRFGRVLFEDEDRSTVELASELVDAVEHEDPTRVVLDVRDNPGGELPAGRPLVAALQDIARERPGALRILVNRCTFSAAALIVAELLATTDASLLGEPMGGAAGIWADARPYTLPTSGIVVHVATRWYEAGNPDAPPLIEPDRTILPTWADHNAGRDPVLEAAISP